MEISNKSMTGNNAVVNCAGADIETGPNFYGPDFDYMQIDARDSREYNILEQHFDEVRAFIEAGTKESDRTMVHCVAGINRSGVLTTAYCLLHGNQSLLDTLRAVSSRRRCILSNLGFRLQLIRFAKKHGRLGSLTSCSSSIEPL
uniref:protein-tyrosine-phosphatase n=1 Tax=Compsopogon caeruleus TaxID=31354 RepID=A0A7S1TFV9_9RHOD|mmetsp:Transcript_18656/g.39216  ORF Transcript_18656/g.39216 Transcript_18656/m.39216 type:complete len:145 (+) Transcript_18656:65-499(+)